MMSGSIGRAARAMLVRSVAGVVALVMGSAAQALPPNVQETLIAPGVWNQATGVVVGPDGRLFVWEKGGRVWNVENGVRAAQPLIDLREEVGDWRDYGLLGFAIDPNFAVNGYIYLLYTVDYHHARFFGTPQYNPATDTYFRDTIGRLTRYACNPADGFRSVLPASRTVLIGESLSTGLPHNHQSHGVGALVWGDDGSLLLSCGDGASYETVDTGGPTSGSSNTALADGIIRQAEDVGAYRSQLVNGLNGKVLRIDPATGDGIPSNPFYVPGQPGLAQSRVWSLGLRNPFRFTKRPGTGNPDPAAGDPGTLYIGDVGWNVWEEINVARGPAANFGWPVYEGMQAHPNYSVTNTPNRDALNPLFGIGGCTQQFFYFRNLLVQDTLAAPSWPNPCNGGLQIPSSLFRFEHTRARVDWGHNGPARVPVYSGSSAAVINIGAPGSPCIGPQFEGNSSTGGAWFAGVGWPAQFQNSYYHADFQDGWIKQFIFDANDECTEVRDFLEPGNTHLIVDIESSPAGDVLYYVAFSLSGESSVRELRYVNNLAPIAQIAATPRFGPLPLTVSFSSAGSSDPEGQPLTYAWNFGDGSPVSTLANPAYQYRNEEDITAQGAFTARVFSLVPPRPTGGGNWDPEIMRDGDYPPVGNQDSARQYDTFHSGEQGSTDFVGYTFTNPRSFTRLIFQEGNHFSDGGWWDSFLVQYRAPGTPNTWLNVPGSVIVPVYGGNDGETYETYIFTFPPISATGLRIFGNPGGSANFISVGELRVLAEPLTPSGPRRHDVTLTVRDPLNAIDTKTIIVSTNNTPPVVNITSPVDGSLYPPDMDTLANLTADITDTEHSAGELTCAWAVILHHNNHIHPEPIDTNCATTALVSPHGVGGDVFFYQFTLTVSDAHGLSTTDTVFMFPQQPPACPGDADGDGMVGLSDVATLIGNWGASGPGQVGDLDGDGTVGLGDLALVINNWGVTCPGLARANKSCPLCRTLVDDSPLRRPWQGETFGLATPNCADAWDSASDSAREEMVKAVRD